MYELDDVNDYAIDLPPVIENKEEDVVVLQELNEDTPFEEGVEVLEQLLSDRDKLLSNMVKLQEFKEFGINETTRQVVAESASFRKYLEKRYLGKTGYSFANEAFFYGGDTRQILAIESEESSNIFVKIWNAIKKAFNWFIDKVSNLLFGDPAKEANALLEQHDQTLKAINQNMQNMAKAEAAQIAKFKEATKGLDEDLESVRKTIEENIHSHYLTFKKGIEDAKVLNCLNDLLGSYYITHDILETIGDIQERIDSNIRNKSLTVDVLSEAIGLISRVHEKMPSRNVDLTDYKCSQKLQSMAEGSSVNGIPDFAQGGMLCLAIRPDTGRFHFEFIELKFAASRQRGLEPIKINPSSIVETDWLKRKREFDNLAKANREFREKVDKIKNHYSKEMDTLVEQSVEDFNKEMASSGKSEEEVARVANMKILMSMEKDIMTSLAALGRASASVNHTFNAFEKELGKSIKKVEKALNEVSKTSKEDNA